MKQKNKDLKGLDRALFCSYYFDSSHNFFMIIVIIGSVTFFHTKRQYFMSSFCFSIFDFSYHGYVEFTVFVNIIYSNLDKRIKEKGQSFAKLLKHRKPLQFRFYTKQ